MNFVISKKLFVHLQRTIPFKVNYAVAAIKKNSKTTIWWIDMSLHSGILTRFWANQPLHLLLIAVCLEEKKQIPILHCLWF